MISKNHKTIFFLAITGCFLGVLADVLLLYTPNGKYEIPGYHFLKDIEIPRMTIGSLLGFFAIPFEILGIFILLEWLKNQGQKISNLLVVALLFILTSGVLIHIGYLFTRFYLDKQPELPEIFFGVMKFTETILVVLFLIINIVLFIKLKKTGLFKTRSLILFNPITTYALWILMYILIPVIGNMVVVTGFNLSIGIFLIYLYSNNSFKQSLIPIVI